MAELRELELWQVDAFAQRTFEGNPAAVVLLEAWLDDATMQQIAAENALSETAFCLRSATGYELRWFTPNVEVPLCGHATLATAKVLFDLDPALDHVSFASKAGPLEVRRGTGGLIVLDFPARPGQRLEAPPGLARALGYADGDIQDVEWNGEKLLVEVRDRATVLAAWPDFAVLARLEVVVAGQRLPAQGVVVTARDDTSGNASGKEPGSAANGDGYDFVSRYFAPRVAVPEDPVTGSAHCMLVPYWSERLGKNEVRAFQCSARGGEVHGRLVGDRVHLAGHAALYLRGRIRC